MRTEHRNNKRIPFIHTSLFLLLLLLAGCDKEHTSGYDTPGGEITFDIGFAPTTRATTDAAFNTTWENGDEIGLFAVQHANGSTGVLSSTPTDNYINNAKLTYNKSTDTWTADAGDNLCFPMGTDELDFYAYYPYDNNGGSPSTLNPTAISFNVNADQSALTAGKSNYNTSDLMIAAPQKNVVRSTTPVALTFSHALALVEVTVDNPNVDHKTPLTAHLRSVKPAAILDLGAAAGSKVSLAVTDNIPVNIAMHRVEQPADAGYKTKYTYRALVPAQVVVKDAGLFFLEQNNKMFHSIPLTADLHMTAGEAKRYAQALPFINLMLNVPAGTFLMGSSDGSNIGDGDGSGLNTTPAEPDRAALTETQHRVTLTKDFYMGKYEITNAQYAAFLNAKGVTGTPNLTHPLFGEFTGAVCNWGENVGRHLLYDASTNSKYSSDENWGINWDGTNNRWMAADGHENHPVIWVTGFGALEFARWVGMGLPTEAQWEYACRAGQATSRPFGVGAGYVLDHTLANFSWGSSWSWDGSSANATYPNSGISPGKTQEVGTYPANGYGLYDMHGNVWEWCSDWYETYSIPALPDPEGPISGYDRVLRGGGWFFGGQYCRSAHRDYKSPGHADINAGFRVVFVP